MYKRIQDGNGSHHKGTTSRIYGVPRYTMKITEMLV